MNPIHLASVKAGDLIFLNGNPAPARVREARPGLILGHWLKYGFLWGDDFTIYREGDCSACPWIYTSRGDKRTVIDFEIGQP